MSMHKNIITFKKLFSSNAFGLGFIFFLVGVYGLIEPYFNPINTDISRLTFIKGVYVEAYQYTAKDIVSVLVLKSNDKIYKFGVQNCLGSLNNIQPNSQIKIWYKNSPSIALYEGNIFQIQSSTSTPCSFDDVIIKNLNKRDRTKYLPYIIVLISIISMGIGRNKINA